MADTLNMAETGTAKPSGPMLPAAVSEQIEKLRNNPLARKAALPAAIATSIGAGLLGWMLFSSPEMAPLYRQLPEADKSSVVAALETAGMNVSLDRATGDILLPPDDHARARMLLAGQGLPRAAPAGSDMLSDMPLGTSRAIEGAKLKSAQERDLAQSIESLQGIEKANVLIARPESSPFIRDRPPVTASITLTLAPGRTLAESQSRAIVHLVAGAVPGLSPDHVAIADQMGRLLAGEPGGTANAADERRVRMQSEMEARARQAILTLLGPVVGPENVTAQVNIELDLATREATQERYDPAGALRSEQLERSTSSEPRAIGIPGALSNTIPSAATVTENAPPTVGGPTITTTGNESSTRNFELGRSVEVSSHNGGQVRRLTAAVAIRAEALGTTPANQAQMMAEIRALVEGAVGYNAQRGDKIAVAARAFASPQAEETPIWKEPTVIESSKWLAVALVAIALLAFVIRPLVKRFTAAKPAPAINALVPVTGPQDDSIAANPAQAQGSDQVHILEPVDYSAKLAEARLMAASDTARATAVARRLLTGSSSKSDIEAMA